MDSPQTKVRAVSIVGTLLLAIALSFSVYEHAAIRARTITTGELSEFKMDGERLSIKFTPQTGAPVVFWNRGYHVTQKAMDGKEAIRVAYDPRHPSDARLLTFGARFGWWFWLGGFGLVLIFHRLGAWFGQRWMARHYPINEEPPPDLEASNLAGIEKLKLGSL